MKLTAIGLAAGFLANLISVLCQAQEFSADVVYVAARTPHASTVGAASAPHHSSKLYVSEDKMRLETRGLTGTILLVDRGENINFALFPANKEYQPLAAGPSEYFRVANVADACPDWQRASDHKIGCEKVGPDIVNGRKSVKYRNKIASKDSTAAVWIDSALKFVIKWEGASTGAELRNIKEEKQAAGLFAVPSGYESMKASKVKHKGFSQPSP